MDRPYAYETDPHAWALEQADALRRRAANEVDWDNVAEEIESVGKQQVAEFRNRLVVLIAHLLKWMAQPDHRSRSWRLAIVEQRRALAVHMADNPSLKAKLDQVFSEAFGIAVVVAARETDLDEDAFPASAPFIIEQALNPAWLPDDEPAAQ